MAELISVVFGASKRPDDVHEVWFRANIEHNGHEYTMTEDQCLHGLPKGMTAWATAEFLVTVAIELMRAQEAMGSTWHMSDNIEV